MHGDAIRILRMINASGEAGLTVDEIEVSGGFVHQTASARVTELYQGGLVADSKRMRYTRQGRRAIVWVATGTEPIDEQLDLFGGE